MSEVKSFYISNDRYYGGKNGMKQSGYLVLENNKEEIPIMIKYSNKVNKTYVSMSNYNNSALSECIASSIINLFDLNIKAHHTFFFNFAPKQCVACVDFTFDINFKNQYKFYTLHEIMNASYEDTNDFYNVLDTFKELNYEKEFYELFLIDALLANRDRHSNNIGFLIIDNQKVLSPIYANASALFPNSTIEDILNKDKDIKRTNEYTKSALTINNKRIDIKEFIKTYKEPVFLEILQEFKNKYQLNINRVKDFITNFAEINSIQKDFYINLIEARFNNIINQPKLKLKI